jgi:D-alanyl-D-alanine carboxypeptidase
VRLHALHQRSDAAVTPPPDAEAVLRALLEQRVGAAGAPGGVAASIDARGRLRVVATGTTTAGGTTPMPTTARMPGGSTGKMTAAATARVVAAAAGVDLDLPVADLLGGRPWFDRLPGAPALTLRHLATHTCGIPDFIAAPGFADVLRGEGPDHAADPEAYLALVADAPPLFPPGSRFSYTESGYLVLGRAVEAVGGADYHDLAERHVLRPLGMRCTTPQTSRRIAGVVQGHALDADGRVLDTSLDEAGRFRQHPGGEWTGGGYVTTAADLARLVRGVGTGAVAPAPCPDDLRRTALGWLGDTVVAYGFGAFVGRADDVGEVVWHTGFYPGYGSLALHATDLGVSVALQCNGQISTDAFVDALVEREAAARRQLPADATPAAPLDDHLRAVLLTTAAPR